MKSIGLLISSFLIIIQLCAQEKFIVPEVSPEQKQEILYSHVIAYEVAGIRFAKSQGVLPRNMANTLKTCLSPFGTRQKVFMPLPMACCLF